MTPGLAGIAAIALYGLGLVGWRMTRSVPLAGRGGDGSSPAQRRSPVAAFRRAVGRGLGPRILSSFSERARRRLEHRLDAAGRPDRMTIAGFAETKAADFGVCLVLGLFAAVISPWLTLLLVVYGWFRAEVVLRGAAKRRQAQIERDLPDFLDVLAVTILAGLKFRGALRRVEEQFASPVAEEFRTAMQQMDVGASRRAAFEGLRQRNDSRSLNRFIGALLQAEELGSPLTDAMVAISVDMRKAFSQDVRKRAAEAAPKVSLVATILLMPGAALLLLGGLIIGGNIDFSSLAGG
ncbi:DUF5936 domain-containing protein [soil metagenome]